MVSVPDLEEIFFNIFSTIVMTHEEQEEDHDEDLQSSQNMEPISMSCTTEPIQTTPVDVAPLNISKNTLKVMSKLKSNEQAMIDSEKKKNLMKKRELSL